MPRKSDNRPPKISIRYRLTVTWPVSFIRLIESLISVLTLAYLPRRGWSLDFLFRRAMAESRRETARSS